MAIDSNVMYVPFPFLILMEFLSSFPFLFLVTCGNISTKTYIIVG